MSLLVFAVNLGQIMMLIFIPVGVILLLVLLFYLFGNVYNGLMKRKNRMEHSWYELTKSLKKSYDLIPSLLQEQKMDKKNSEVLKDIYQQYKSADIENLPPHQVAEMDEVYQNTLKILTKQTKKSDALDYVNEYRRLTDFSVPLYNHNVRDYQKFKSMVINRQIAKMIRLPEGEIFQPDPTKGDSTVDIRLKDFIDKKQD
jgi:hypothetical protein